MKVAEYSRYVKLTPIELTAETVMFKDYTYNAQFLWGDKYDDILIDENTFLEIIERVHKRKVYYHIFHNVDGLSIIKETALHCFWILKLQPYFWKSRMKETNYELNAKMALIFLQQGVNSYAFENDKKANFTAEILQDLYYSFRYNDLSKEAIIDIAKYLIIN